MLEPYIRSNTYVRIISQSDFNKGTDKRLSKSIFGKSIQNENNDIDLRFVNMSKYISSIHTKKWFYIGIFAINWKGKKIEWNQIKEDL